MLHKTIIEKELLEQVLKNNEKAFKTLFDMYHGRIFNYVFRIIKSHQVAEELVMDVFLKIWVGKELALQIGNFEAFIFRVAHNKCIDFFRSVAKDPKFQDVLWDQIQVITGERADSTILNHEFDTKLREAISLLSPQRKKVFQLSRVNEMSHEQIAGVLGISKNTVNNHIMEAQKFIRAYLSDRFDIAFLTFIVWTLRQ